MVEVWEWYYSQDGENYQGPCDTRGQAIEEGCVNFDGEAFEIAEATKGKLKAFVWRNLSEWLDEANEEMGNPDGDPIAVCVKEPEWHDLFKRLDAAAREWADANNIHRHVWAFDKIRNREDIPVEVVTP